MSTIYCPKCGSTNVSPRTNPSQKSSIFKKIAKSLFGEEFVEFVTDVTSAALALVTEPYQCNNCGHTWQLIHEMQNTIDRIETQANSNTYVSHIDDLELDGREMCPVCGTRFHLTSEDTCPACGYKWSSIDQKHWTIISELENISPEDTPIEKILIKIEQIIEYFKDDGLTFDSLNYHLLYAYYLKSVMYSVQHINYVLEGNFKDADIYRREAKSNIAYFLMHLDNPTIRGKLLLKKMIDSIYHLTNPFDKIEQRLLLAESDIESYRWLLNEIQNIKRYNNELSEYRSLELTFTQSVDPSNRSIIFIGDRLDDLLGYTNPNNVIDYIFFFPSIPADIQFPLGGPKLNTLYVVNPVKPNEYVPYDNHEYILFKDKIRELKRLLRYLGATEITFTSMRGASYDEIEKSSWNATAEGKFNLHKPNGKAVSNKKHEQKSSSGLSVDHLEKLNPFSYPSFPNDLYWYESDPEWKDIVEARLHHNQLHFEQSISTNQVSSLDKQSQLDVNAAYENLLLSINANFHRERELHMKKTEETMWRITAEFKPLSEFENSDKAVTKSQQNLSSNEQKYLHLVKKVSAGGMISELNRKMLEQIRIKLNISEERAKDLEASLIPQLSEEEKVYLEAVRQYLADGTIGESERVLLQTLRELNNISEERASELEAMA